MITNLYDIDSDGKLRLRFHKGQTQAWDSHKRFIFVLAGTQGGKTSYGPWWLWREIKLTANPKGNNDYLAVTSTFPLLKLKMLPEFLRIFHHTLQMGKWWAADKIYELADPATGKLGGRGSEWGRIIFCSAKNAESIESATAKGAWLDEVGQNDFRVDAWEAIVRRLLLNKGRVLGTTTLYNWGWMKQQIYDPWKRGESDDIEVVQFKSISNPSFPRDEYLRVKANMPSWRFKMAYEGLYDKPAGMIYDSFDFEMHVCPPFDIPYDWEIYVGIDFGGVNMAALFTAKSPEGRFYHWHEYLMGNRSIEQHAEEFRRLIGDRPLRWIGGAQPEDQWRLEFNKAGIPVRPPPISDVEVGIKRVYGYHRRNQIMAFNTLTKYLDQKGSYARKLDDNNQPTEDIEDKNTYHLLDAERVLFADIFEYQGGITQEALAKLHEATRSRWIQPMPTSVGTEASSYDGRWKRGRRF